METQNETESMNIQQEPKQKKLRLSKLNLSKNFEIKKGEADSSC